MNENVEENVFATLSNSNVNDNDDTYTQTSVADTVSSGDTSNLLYSVVSVSDTVSSGDVASGTTIQVETDNTEIVENLQAINSTLVIILFFMLYKWGEERIKNAVRSFTGIGLKEKK